MSNSLRKENFVFHELKDEFQEQYRDLHHTRWIHSRTMEDASFYLLHSLLWDKFDEKFEEAMKLANEVSRGREIGDEDFESLCLCFLDAAVLRSVTEALEEKYPERIKQLVRRDISYFLQREAKKIEAEIQKKHPRIKIVTFLTNKIDPSFSCVPHGELSLLFGIKCNTETVQREILDGISATAETEIRAYGYLRFLRFVHSLNPKELKSKRTGLYAACCYLETYLHGHRSFIALLPLSKYCLESGIKPAILILPISQEEWAKAFKTTRQTLNNRIRELEKADPMVRDQIRFVTNSLA